METLRSFAPFYMVLAAFLFAGCYMVDDPKPAAEAAALHITQDELAEITGLVSALHPGQVVIGFNPEDDGSISVLLGDNPNAKGGAGAVFRKKNGHWYEAAWNRWGWAV